MSTLALQKCLNHPAREAAARCLECAQPYCRECVVPHEGRLLCSACLRRLARPKIFRGGWARKMASALQLAAALFFLWLCFFAFGKVLLAIPASFHEGDVWKAKGDAP
jgi:hypothetical protein